MAKSPQMTWKGYRFSEALYRNIDSIKAIIAIIGGLNFASILSAGFDWKTLGISLGAALAALMVKLLADAVDFYFKEVDLPK
jgi:hypothetical protein